MKTAGKLMKKVLYIIVVCLSLVGAYYLYKLGTAYMNRVKVLNRIVERLEADTRIAEVLVSGVKYDESTGKNLTTIKFLEYDTQGEPMEPRYFTFPGNIIQFQSLVVRFEDMHIRKADRLKDKSAYLFWKVFMLDGEDTVEYTLTDTMEVPGGYSIEDLPDPHEAKIWEKFWEYALDPEKADSVGIKNAQIEAPGTMFVPGTLYELRIEHDGGMRIDAKPLPEIVRGEKIG